LGDVEQVLDATDCCDDHAGAEVGESLGVEEVELDVLPGDDLCSDDDDDDDDDNITERVFDAPYVDHDDRGRLDSVSDSVSYELANTDDLQASSAEVD